MNKIHLYFDVVLGIGMYVRNTDTVTNGLLSVEFPPVEKRSIQKASIITPSSQDHFFIFEKGSSHRVLCIFVARVHEREYGRS